MPSSVVPSKNSTVPVGVPPPTGVTVAVRLTDWPNVEGLVEEVNVVEVGDATTGVLTVWLTVPVLVAFLASPL